EAPFTTGFSNESAPRVGIWLGWQIVKAYHENHPEISLNELISNADTQEILQKSGYKP
ncbi:MAG: gliding motility lipoprotein GldB, partial [Bacteroidetes bacterium CG_4_9_14_3_um_filter_41_19]